MRLRVDVKQRCCPHHYPQLWQATECSLPTAYCWCCRYVATAAAAVQRAGPGSACVAFVGAGAAACAAAAAAAAALVVLEMLDLPVPRILCVLRHLLAAATHSDLPLAIVLCFPPPLLDVPALQPWKCAGRLARWRCAASVLVLTPCFALLAPARLAF